MTDMTLPRLYAGDRVRILQTDELGRLAHSPRYACDREVGCLGTVADQSPVALFGYPVVAVTLDGDTHSLPYHCYEVAVIEDGGA